MIQMTDIHMHLIPDVDDGAMDMPMALTMLLQAREQGITEIFATAHSSAFDDDPALPCRLFSALKTRAERLLPDMKLYLGCEVYCDSSGMDQVLGALKSGKYPGMNGTEYVLMEFSMWVRPDAALRCVEAVAGAGWTPIIAHMERYAYLRQMPELVDRFRSLGALIQINAYSVYEEGESAIKDWARYLVARKMVDFLGTDAHRTYHRPPNALSGLRWLYQNHDKAYIDAIAHGNARRLLIDKE